MGTFHKIILYLLVFRLNPLINSYLGKTYGYNHFLLRLYELWCRDLFKQSHFPQLLCAPVPSVKLPGYSIFRALRLSAFLDQTVFMLVHGKCLNCCLTVSADMNSDFPNSPLHIVIRLFIAFISAWKTMAYCPKRIELFKPGLSPYTLEPVPSLFLEPSVYRNTSPELPNMRSSPP